MTEKTKFKKRQSKRYAENPCEMGAFQYHIFEKTKKFLDTWSGSFFYKHMDFSGNHQSVHVLKIWLIPVL